MIDLITARTVTLHLDCFRGWSLQLSIQNQTKKSTLSPPEGQQGMKKDTSSKKSGTNWDRLRAMRDDEIDLSDCPEVTPSMFARAVVRRGLKPIPSKAQVTLRVDRDVLEWFRKR